MNLPPSSSQPSPDRHAANIIAEHFATQHNQLEIGGQTVEELVRQFGSPLYVYDEAAIGRQLNKLRTAFGQDFQIYYSVKANPDPRIVEFLHQHADGLEVASEGELRSAMQLGCPAHQILFAGPGKSTRDLELAVSSAIGEIHIESLVEARRIAEIADRRAVNVPICLRINPIGDVQGGAMRMGGKATQFGIDEEQIESTLRAIRAYDRLHVQGVHLFIGTQILDADVLLQQYRHFVEVADRVAQQLGNELKSIDFGGGLGVPYFAHENELDLAKLQAGLPDVVQQVRSCKLLRSARLLIEPGRYLVADAGVYVTRVTDIKMSRGKTFVVVDGGMHHHLAASGNLGQTIKRNYPIAVLNRLRLPQTETSNHAVQIVGSLCTPLDTLGRNVSVSGLKPGDLIGFLRSGAYGVSASPIGFLGHDAPAEVYLGKGQVSATRIIRSHAVVPPQPKSNAGQPSENLR